MSVLILSVFGIIILRVLFQFIDRHLFKRIRVPKKIKTQHGYLFRSYSGVYVPKDQLNDVNDDYMFKNKQRAIGLA